MRSEEDTWRVRRRILGFGILLILIAGSIADILLAGPLGPGPWMLGMSLGLLLLVMHVPETGVLRNVPMCCRVAYSMLVGLVTIYSATYPFLQVPSFGDYQTEVSDAWIMLAALGTTGFVYIVCILKSHPPSLYTHDAKWCMLGVLLATAAYQCFDAGRAYRASGFCDFALAFSVSLDSVVLGWILTLFQARLRLLTSTLTASRTWIYVMCGAFVSSSACTVIQRRWSLHGGLVVFLVVKVVFLSIWLIYSIIACVALYRGLRILWLESRRAKGVAKQQAKWAAGVLMKELFLGFTLFSSTLICWSTITYFRYLELIDPEEYDRNSDVDWTYVSALRCVDALVNTVDLAFFSGILWQGSPPEDPEMESGPKLKQMASMIDFLDASQRAVYQTKLQELAKRGFHLRSLLNFWEELLDGHLMPSFDPRRSQTNDVVRQAIIPSSRVGRGGRALVDIWEKEPVLPDNMVTHHWTNSFANLVAAMLADALQEPTYAPLAEKLCSRSGCHALRRRLEETNRIDATYWVCAVSVNQHASICGGYGPEPPEGTPQWTLWDEKRHDSVTQQRFRLCNCEEPKRLSHRDATCELNKFDDMIRFLSQRVTTFEHLLVVDQHFDVLYRAWCVAEIVEGNALGIPAKIKVYSQNAVDCNYDRLSLLDVRQCSASSQEDKDFILQKIGNIQAFNLKLQQLVFSSEGLFSDWVDGKERSRLVGRIWRRSACHSRFLRGHSCSSSEEDLPSDSSGVSTSEASESSELSESGQ